MKKETLLLRAFGLFKVPMLFWLGPQVVAVNGDRCEISIPLTRRSKNHLGGMYFGALCAGADCAGGLIAMRMIQEAASNSSTTADSGSSGIIATTLKRAKARMGSDLPVALIFKDFQAKFLKRAEGDVHFVCEQGAEIRKTVRSVLSSTERMEVPVRVVAYVPKISTTDAVAEFVLTLSLKARTPKKPL